LTFNRKAADKLFSLRGKEIDHTIKLNRKGDEIESKVSWGSMYRMFRDKLLALRKTLIELLDKEFIRVSNSSATIFILFMKKSGEKLRFCINYQALNKLIYKDRYPLLLI